MRISRPKMSKKQLTAALVIICALAVSYLYGGNYAAKSPTRVAGDASGKNLPAAKRSDEPSLAQGTRIEHATNKSQEDTQASGNSMSESEQRNPADETRHPVKNPGQSSEPATSPSKAQTPCTTLADSTGETSDASRNSTGQTGETDNSGSNSVSTEKMVIDPETGKDKYLTDPVPEGKPLPVEWQEMVVEEDTALTCTLLIECSTILDNMHMFNKDKLEVLPEDGIIYAKKEVTFYKGESVFNVLLREVKQNRIHMEFSMFPIYNSNYIEGINNIYEFDCGELSGWMYKVNGWFPNYGCSRYLLEHGDVIEWVYTCDLGRDVGCEWLGDK
ncbi:MAG: DUF4430 domain-containing protein [Bacillota bacterium]